MSQKKTYIECTSEWAYIFQRLLPQHVTEVPRVVCSQPDQRVDDPLLDVNVIRYFNCHDVNQVRDEAWGFGMRVNEWTHLKVIDRPVELKQAEGRVYFSFETLWSSHTVKI